MRFDDNTPLPDDFDFASQPATPPPEAVAEPEPIAEPKEAQVDLAFGDPDEWQDLLGDIDQPEAVEEADDIAEADEPGEAQEAEEAEPTADGEDDDQSLIFLMNSTRRKRSADRSMAIRPTHSKPALPRASKTVSRSISQDRFFELRNSRRSKGR